MNTMYRNPALLYAQEQARGDFGRRAETSGVPFRDISTYDVTDPSNPLNAVYEMLRRSSGATGLRREYEGMVQVLVVQKDAVSLGQYRGWLAFDNGSPEVIEIGGSGAKGLSYAEVLTRAQEIGSKYPAQGVPAVDSVALALSPARTGQLAGMADIRINAGGKLHQVEATLDGRGNHTGFTQVGARVLEKLTAGRSVTAVTELLAAMGSAVKTEFEAQRGPDLGGKPKNHKDVGR